MNGPGKWNGDVLLEIGTSYRVGRTRDFGRKNYSRREDGLGPLRGLGSGVVEDKEKVGMCREGKVNNRSRLFVAASQGLVMRQENGNLNFWFIFGNR